MHIDAQLILALENLARLELDADERRRMLQDLNGILKMIEKLEELDTSDVEPLIHVNDPCSPLRPDEIGEQFSSQEATRNAPDSDGIFYRVPKVIDTNKQE